jgi:hypothetical protein
MDQDDGLLGLPAMQQAARTADRIDGIVVECLESIQALDSVLIICRGIGPRFEAARLSTADQPEADTGGDRRTADDRTAPDPLLKVLGLIGLEARDYAVSVLTRELLLGRVALAGLGWPFTRSGLRVARLGRSGGLRRQPVHHLIREGES